MEKEKGNSLYERIYNVIRQIPPGKVATYGRIAMLTGNCSARQVGYALSALRNKEANDVPWYRVINSQGKVSLPGDGALIQRDLLASEGITFEGDKTNLKRFGWFE